MKKNLLTCLFLLLPLTSCNSSDVTQKEYNIINSYDDLNHDVFYNEFYDYTSDIEITLNFTNESIYRLALYSDNDYKKEMYHPVDLTIKMNGETYVFNDAGARMKGNTSRNSNFVNEHGEILAPVHFKISVSQTFDDKDDNDYYFKTYDDDNQKDQIKKRRIGNAKKFDIKYNKNEDFSFTKQIYAYNCYENEGLVVQKNNLVKVNIVTQSDSYTTLYELQECIDEEFIERRFKEDEISGDLYKCTYSATGPASLKLDTLNAIGIEKDTFHPSYDLKTNKKTSDHSLLKNFITTINIDKSPSEVFKNTLDEILDVESFLKFSAMSWVIGNPDDLRNNYNNYYMYFNPSNDKAMFIPYDFDRCFGIMKDWPVEMQNIPYYTTKQNLIHRYWQENPLMWRTIISTKDNTVPYSIDWPVINEYQEIYKNLCIEYANKYLDVDKYQEFVNQFVYAQKDIKVPGANNISFASYCVSKLDTFNM